MSYVRRHLDDREPRGVNTAPAVDSRPLCNPEQVTGGARHYSGEVLKLRAAVAPSFAVPTEYLSLHKYLLLARNVVFERAA